MNWYKELERLGEGKKYSIVLRSRFGELLDIHVGKVRVNKKMIRGCIRNVYIVLNKVKIRAM